MVYLFIKFNFGLVWRFWAQQAFEFRSGRRVQRIGTPASCHNGKLDVEYSAPVGPADEYKIMLCLCPAKAAYNHIKSLKCLLAEGSSDPCCIDVHAQGQGNWSEVDVTEPAMDDAPYIRSCKKYKTATETTVEKT